MHKFPASGGVSMQFRRILLKISGEALMGDGAYGISPDMISFVAQEIKKFKSRVRRLLW
ncbi:hypothetical protein VU11_02755 [Desulfobulbus sp. US2]|nr:hypothetical protein [Desulfobulbus sp. US2]